MFYINYISYYKKFILLLCKLTHKVPITINADTATEDFGYVLSNSISLSVPGGKMPVIDDNRVIIAAKSIFL